MTENSRIDHGLTGKQWDMVKTVEHKKEALFLGCFPVGGYNGLVFCFYQKKAHPRGSNYFGLYYRRDAECWMIVDAREIEDKEFTGIKKDGKILYSRYRHDCRTYGKDMIDGGWDYCRYNMPSKGAKLVSCKIVGGHVEITGGGS